MDGLLALQKLWKAANDYGEVFGTTKQITVSMLLRMIERSIEELEDESEQDSAREGYPF